MRGVLLPGVAVLLLGCPPAPATGPAPVAWDRDTCERCNMVIGDRRFAAQVRLHDGEVHRFDDLGCALLWIDEHGGANAADEIWVRDLDGRRWLPAESARYVHVESTPMDYALGAVEGPGGDGVDLARAREQVRTAERERRSAGR